MNSKAVDDEIDVFCVCNQLYGAGGSQYRLNKFHCINAHSPQLFRRMGRCIPFCIQSVTPNRTCRTLSSSSAAPTVGMSGIAARNATRKAVSSQCQKYLGNAVMIEDSG